MKDSTQSNFAFLSAGDQITFSAEGWTFSSSGSSSGTTTGGTSISASVRDLDNAQRSINAMRALIKNKKMG